jgi:hypothetical protein
MRRVVPLLLSLLVFCAQSAGLLHGIDHAAARQGIAPSALHGATAGTESIQARRRDATVVAPSVPASPPGAMAAAESAQAREPSALPGPAEHRCDKCYQYANFSGAAAPQPPQLQFAQVADAHQCSTQAALFVRDAPAWRNRGPPVAA